MSILRAQRPDGTFGDLQADEHCRLRIAEAEADTVTDAGLIELQQTEGGELLVAHGGG